MIYLKLLYVFFLIGTLAFGGGYAVLPLIQQQCVEKAHWLSMTEFTDLLTLSQITPGPIAINAATFVGMKVGGLIGSLIASFAFLLPPFLIVSLLYAVYRKYGRLSRVQDALNGLKPGVVGLIAVAGIGIIVDTVWGESAVTFASADVFSAVLILVTLFVMRKWKTGVITTILACGVIGVLREIVLTLLK
jgi:chromate transporter